MTIGERIKSRREELGLTQEELAKKMGYKTRNAIYQYEQVDNMKLSLAEKFAKALDVPVSYLIGWEEEEKQHLNKDNAILLAQLTKAYINGEYLKKLSELPDKDKETIYGLIDVLWSATHSGEQQ